MDEMMTGRSSSEATSTRERMLRPDEIINRLRAQYPKANAAQLGELYKSDYRARVEYEDDQTQFEDNCFISYWLKREVFDPKPADKKPAAATTRTRPQTPEQKAEATARRDALASEIRARDQERIETLIKIRLLEWQTPYGKRLADCTGAECLRLSRRYGSFFAEVGKRMTASEKVKNHLTEAELQAIAATHKLVGPEALR